MGKKCGSQEILTASLLISIGLNAHAVSDEVKDKLNNWQMNMIDQPSQSLLDREARGFVNIYDGFTDVQVDQVMDDNFDRIDNMMFIGIKKTAPTGAVLRDPETGEEMIEDDGC